MFPPGLLHNKTTSEIRPVFHSRIYKDMRDSVMNYYR